MDIFKRKNIKPMLIGETKEAFDSPDYIYELKLDGERCIAYLDEEGTELRNKRNLKMLPKVPELAEMHKQVDCRCILDGELIILKNGKPDFFEIQRRSLTSNSFKIQLAAAKLPATFTAFDLLYYQDRTTIDLPLMKRKELLSKAIVKETERLAISRYIEKQGVQFYQLAAQNELEGIVAKKKDSKYYFGKRTKEWIKIKNLFDDDFVVCGFIYKDKGITSIVLGQYSATTGELLYKGHVTLGISSKEFQIIKAMPRKSNPPFQSVPVGNEKAIWIEPRLVCTVKYMMKTATGYMRQAVFKGLRDDKKPEECIEK